MTVKLLVSTLKVYRAMISVWEIAFGVAHLLIRIAAGLVIWPLILALMTAANIREEQAGLALIAVLCGLGIFAAWIYIAVSTIMSIV